MNGIILDSAINSIARYLVRLEDLVVDKYQGSVDIKEEIISLNNQYKFVSADQTSALVNDIYRMYDFERNRQIKSISKIAYAKYKLDHVSGDNDFQRLKNELHNELTGSVSL